MEHQDELFQAAKDIMVQILGMILNGREVPAKSVIDKLRGVDNSELIFQFCQDDVCSTISVLPVLMSSKAFSSDFILQQRR